MNESSIATINEVRVRVYDAAGKLTDEFNYIPLIGELPQDKWIWVSIQPTTKSRGKSAS